MKEQIALTTKFDSYLIRNLLFTLNYLIFTIINNLTRIPSNEPTS